MPAQKQYDTVASDCLEIVSCVPESPTGMFFQAKVNETSYLVLT